MNINISRGGIGFIGICFVIFAIINLFLFGIGWAVTLGVFFPYIGFTILNFLVVLIRDKKMVIYSDWQVMYIIGGLEIILIFYHKFGSFLF